MGKIIGQFSALKIMSGIYKSGRLHHAYLFYGTEGVGKFESAINYAKAIMCKRGDGIYCGECESCKAIDNFKHPDLVVAGTDERFFNAEIYYNQFMKHRGASYLFHSFIHSVRFILYRVECSLFTAYDNYPAQAPAKYMVGNKKDTSRALLLEPYYIAVNSTINSLDTKNADDIYAIFNARAREALEIVKSSGGKKNISIDGDFFDALKKLYYNVVHTVIPLDTVRKIIEITNKKPRMSDKRVIIIEGLDLMDAKAPNIFLRTLEEPTDNNIFILICNDVNKLSQDGIKPLLSRVMDIKFNDLSDTTLSSILLKRLKFDESEIGEISENNFGSVSKALKYLDKNTNTSDNIKKMLCSFLEYSIEDNASKVASIVSKITLSEQNVFDILSSFSSIFREVLESRYSEKGLDIDNLIPSFISDASLVYIAEELDSLYSTLSKTNAQPKLALNKLFSGIYMFFKINKNN